MFGCAQLWLGDGAGGFSAPVVVSDSTYYAYGRAADMNHDGYVDLVCSDGSTSLALVPGGAAGFGAVTEIFMGRASEEYTDFVIGDVNVDGHLDIMLNFLSESADAAGVMRVVSGRGDGTFGSEPFAMAGGQVVVADVIGDGAAARDGLPDIVVARGREIVVLSNRRSQTNRPPLIEATDVTVAYNGFGGGTQCFALPVQAGDPDQHALWLEWLSDGPAVGPGPNPSGLMGRLTSTMACYRGTGYTPLPGDGQRLPRCGGLANRDGDRARPQGDRVAHDQCPAGCRRMGDPRRRVCCVRPPRLQHQPRGAEGHGTGCAARGLRRHRVRGRPESDVLPVCGCA